MGNLRSERFSQTDHGLLQVIGRSCRYEHTVFSQPEAAHQRMQVFEGTSGIDVKKVNIPQL